MNFFCATCYNNKFFALHIRQAAVLKSAYKYLRFDAVLFEPVVAVRAWVLCLSWHFGFHGAVGLDEKYFSVSLHERNQMKREFSLEKFTSFSFQMSRPLLHNGLKEAQNLEAIS
jgi:hypothetical protein